MRNIIVVVALAIALLAPARAADDAAPAKALIAAQAEALSRDDAAGAYALAAPGIKNLFPDPAGFMAMVRGSYAPVYRHKSFDFGEASVVDGRVQQKVRIVDADGVPWDALYTVETQPDGSLKISGCLLLKVGQSV
ncbi:MAG: DUF4864 domain-containing protein [Tardiphaga sp.]